MRTTSPAFSFYPADFIIGTATMSLIERGAYITLLCHQWDKGGVPADAVERARLLNLPLKEARAMWNRIRCKFAQGQDGAWRNLRLELERDKQLDRRAALVAAGGKGGRSTAAKLQPGLSQA